MGYKTNPDNEEFVAPFGQTEEYIEVRLSDDFTLGIHKAPLLMKLFLYPTLDTSTNIELTETNRVIVSFRFMKKDISANAEFARIVNNAQFLLQTIACRSMLSAIPARGMPGMITSLDRIIRDAPRVDLKLHYYNSERHEYADVLFNRCALCVTEDLLNPKEEELLLQFVVEGETFFCSEPTSQNSIMESQENT